MKLTKVDLIEYTCYRIPEGVWHNPHRPAVTYKEDMETAYYLYSKRHNIVGPQRIRSNGCNDYVIKGIYIR